MPLTATADVGHHHFATDAVYFYMNDGDQPVRCGITRLALEALEPELPPTKGRARRSNSIESASSGLPAPNSTADS
jgi:hypothetical protein